MSRSLVDLLSEQMIGLVNTKQCVVDHYLTLEDEEAFLVKSKSAFITSLFD